MRTPLAHATRIALLLSLIAALTPLARGGTLTPPELPKPVTSKDLRAWMERLAPSDAQRVAMEQAFDACVAQWQQLRDTSVRPAQAKLAAAPDDEKAIAGWQATLARATDAMAASERGMFQSMRAACGNETQQAEADRLAAARARKRAGAAVRSPAVNLPKVPGLKELPDDVRARIDARERAWEIAATPTIERLAAASLDASAESRRADLARKVIASQRAAAREIAAMLPKDAAASYLASFRRRALPEGSIWSAFELHAPASLRAKLDPAANAADLAKIDAWERDRAAIEEAAIDALLNEGAPPEALSDLSQQYRALNDTTLRALSESTGMADLAESPDGMVLALGGADEDGEGAMQLSGLAEGGAVVMSSVTTSDTSTDGVRGGAVMSNVVVIRAGDGADMAPIEGAQIRAATVQVQRSGDDATDVQMHGNMGAPPPEVAARIGEQIGAQIGAAISENIAGGMVMTGESADAMPMLAMRRNRPLSRQDIDLLRTRLAVPDTQRAVWDALASDLLQSEADHMKAGGASPMQDMMPAPGQSADEFFKARAERRAELARIEDAWFDNVKAGVQGVNPATVSAEKQRRALQRALGAVRGGGMFMPELMMSRQGRIDLDAAVDTLPPAAQTKAAATLAAWRAQLMQEFAALQPLLDAVARQQLELMKSVTEQDDQGQTRMSMNLTIDDKQVEAMERARTPLRAALKRIEALQQSGVDSVAGALATGDAKALRRAVRKQTHPEAFRSQEKVDAALGRAVALANLTPEQLQAIGTLGDRYRERSDALVERSIERTNASDASVQNLLSDAPGGGEPNARFQAIQMGERAKTDATYDREELNACTLRQLRATLTPEQAAAAKLN